MDRKRLGKRWRNWILGYISSYTFAININDEPKSWFKGQKVVRQGGLLFLFLFFLLFSIVVDVLSCLVSRAINHGLVKGLSIGVERALASHL